MGKRIKKNYHKFFVIVLFVIVLFVIVLFVIVRFEIALFFWQFRFEASRQPTCAFCLYKWPSAYKSTPRTPKIYASSSVCTSFFVSRSSVCSRMQGRILAALISMVEKLCRYADTDGVIKPARPLSSRQVLKPKINR